MSVFDDVIVNAKNIVGSVSRKAEEFVDKSKVRIAISEINGELAKNYQALGIMAYDAMKNNVDVNESSKEYYEKIFELNEQLDSLKDILKSKTDEIICPECGTENAKNSVFCNHCGTKL